MADAVAAREAVDASFRQACEIFVRREAMSDDRFDPGRARSTQQTGSLDQGMAARDQVIDEDN